MNIGLLDIDGHNFPNLALMKLSAWHKSIGDDVEFATMFKSYDILYRSKVFTWTPDNDYAYNCLKEIRGGTGYNIKTILPEEINKMYPDYFLYNCEHAYGFLTRGCIRNCSWCIVPQKEGKIKPETDIEDLVRYKHSAILMDNNILACEYGIKQIEKIGKLKIKVDFNQGLDARLIDDSIAKLLSKIRWLKPLRLACDLDGMIPVVEKAINILRNNHVKPERYFIYCIVKDIGDALNRVKYMDYLGCDPFAQAYRDFDNTEPTIEQKRFCRWVNHKAIFRSVEFSEYL